MQYLEELCQEWREETACRTCAFGPGLEINPSEREEEALASPMCSINASGHSLTFGGLLSLIVEGTKEQQLCPLQRKNPDV